MKHSNPALRTLIHTLLFSSVVMPLAAQAAVNDVVLLWGTSTDTETMFASDQFGQVSTVDTAAACRKVMDFIMQNAPVVGQVLGDDYAIDSYEQLPGPDSPLVRCANPDPADGVNNIWLIYTSCSMTMGDGTHVMRWTVPPLAAEAEAIMIDMTTNQGIQVPLETNLSQVRDNAPLDPMGNLRDYEISGPHQSKPVSLRIDSTQREFQAKSFDYSYSGDIGSANSGYVGIQLGKIVSTGQAWIVPDAPGSDVISLFYKNFRDYVEPPTGMGSLIGGMIKQMAGLTSHGIPVETKQTITMEATAISGMMGVPGAGQKAESTSTINSIMVLPGRAAQTCGATVIPEGVQVQNVNDMMAGTMGGSSTAGAGAAGASNPMNSPEMQEAMQQMAEQMKNMSPEERRMMESMGLGSLMQSTAGAPATQNAAGNTAGGSAKSRSSMPSADDLYSDNMTVMSQRHLQALGYDIDNTSGNASVKTMIAISQFQAENGLKVTGEVSPQLVGALSAAVDKRR